MPIYEYCCDKCQKVFEEWTRHIDDNAVQTCPECGGEARRIVSNTSFVLKGGGWYVTDYGYRKGKNETSESASSGKSSHGGSKAAASGDSGSAGNGAAVSSSGATSSGNGATTSGSGSASSGSTASSSNSSSTSGSGAASSTGSNSKSAA